MSKTLFVVLNKDNADGLMNVLRSLVNQDNTCKICECFDVLIIDGGSKDDSMRIANEFQSKYPCIRFKIQEVTGGVGPARLEAIKYALSNGYSYIIWGDSENIYSKDYVARITSFPENCEIVSGKPIVLCSNIYEKLFFWYHAYHVLFSYVRKRHAPGNNKAVKVSTYSKSTYPPVIRSDDFYFSVIALKKNITFCYNDEALVTVTLPNNWEGIKSWQRSRILGSVQGAFLLKKLLPPDFLPWFLFSTYPLYFIISSILMLMSNPFGYLIMLLASAATLFMLFKLFKLSNEVCVRKCLTTPIAGFIGMYIHSLFTTYYTLKYLFRYIDRKSRENLINTSKEILGKYGFKLDESLN